jgi:hypothetical protein
MKAILSAVLSASVMAGCASTAKTSGELMKLPPEKVMEVDFTASVPASTAYVNILAKAHRCWSGAHRIVVIEEAPFGEDIAVARIAVKTPGAILIPRMMMTVIEITPEGQTAAHLNGRSLRSKIRSVNPQADLPNLKQWAEGTDVPCG